MQRVRLFINFMFAGLIYFGFILQTPARAQDTSLPEESACRICHEDLYYLYDTGKWYCLCSEQRTCSGCHEGVDGVWDVDAAHAGLVANPLAQGARVCQDCHPDDAQVYIEKFAAVAWIDLNPTPRPTQTAYVPLKLAAGEEPFTPALEAKPFEAWQKLAFGFLGPAFLGAIGFGFKCWQADCQRSRREI